MIDALELAIKLVQEGEGCRLTAYPDPATGGAPWTIGWGETYGVKPGMVWTQQEADSALRARVATFLFRALKDCPALHLEPPGRLAACTSLAYNIGSAAFAASSVRRKTMRGDFEGAADSFLLWNKAAGRVMRGLTLRRQRERRIYLD